MSFHRPATSRRLPPESTGARSPANGSFAAPATNQSFSGTARSTTRRRHGSVGPRDAARVASPAATATLSQTFRSQLVDQKRSSPSGHGGGSSSPNASLAGAATDRGRRRGSDPTLEGPSLGFSVRDGVPGERQLEQGKSAIAADVKQRQAIEAALTEVKTLRTAVADLESTQETLKVERDDLRMQLRRSTQQVQDQRDHIVSLTTACEELTSALQSSTVASADRLAKAEADRRETEAALRQRIDMLTQQLVETEHAEQDARNAPWAKVQVDGHPAQTIRSAILADQRREERLHAGALSDDSAVARGMDEALRRLLDQSKGSGVDAGSSSKGDGGPSSENRGGANPEWRHWFPVMARLHTVLSDRQRWLNVCDDDDTPEGFLLRTRHELAGGTVHAHQEVRRAAAEIELLNQRIETGIGAVKAAQKKLQLQAARQPSASSFDAKTQSVLAELDGVQSGGLNASVLTPLKPGAPLQMEAAALRPDVVLASLKPPAETAAATLGDLDYTLAKLQRQCFSAVDMVFHNVTDVSAAATATSPTGEDRPGRVSL